MAGKCDKRFPFWLAMASLATSVYAQPFVNEMPVEVDGYDAPGVSERATGRDRAVFVSRLKSPETSRFPLYFTKLPPPAAGRLELSPPRPGTPAEIGFPRDIEPSAKGQDLSRDLQWLSLEENGEVASISFESPGAAALRLGLSLRKRLPDAIEFRFFRPGDETAIAISGGHINATIERNRAADRDEPGTGIYWSPVVEGERISLEVYAPRGIDTSDLGIYSQTISHMLVSPAGTGPRDLETRIGESGSCNLDVTCYPEWNALSRAVARMVFTKAGSSYLCSGTLLSDVPGSLTPHFLTASHCISSQTVASTLNTYWFYQSASCNSGTLGSGGATLFGGAELLHAGETTDTTLLRLLDSPPVGAYFSGWTTAEPYLSQPSSGMHHPQGDLKKISFGSIRRFFDCDPSGSGSSGFTCWPGTQETSNFLDVQFTAGTTEGGSSGSGVFQQSDQRLIGVLYGGASSCAAPDGINVYGRFDRSYLIGDLGRWLDPGASAYSLTVAKAGIGQGVVTSSPPVIDCGLICSASFMQDQAVELYATAAPGSEFLGWSGDCSGAGACSLVIDGAKNVTATFGMAVTSLNRGDSVIDLSGVAGSSQYFSIKIPEGATNLVIAISGGSGDADLFVQLGELPTPGSYSCGSQGIDSSESCQYSLPPPGVYYIQVYGFTSYSNVTLSVNYDLEPPSVVSLGRGETVYDLADATGSQRYFSIDLPAGASNLVVRTFGGYGDADLYVRAGGLPTLYEFDCGSWDSGNYEECIFQEPAPASHYILLDAYTSYSEVALFVDYDLPIECPYDDVVTYPANMITVAVTAGACHELTLAPGTWIESTGELTLEAGSLVRIQAGGLRIQAGGRLRIAIDNALAQ